MTNTMSLIGHQGAVNALEFHSGTLYSGGADDSVRMWNVLTGQCTISIKLKAPMGVCTPYTRVFVCVDLLCTQLTRHDDSLYVQHATEPAITQVNLKTNKVTKRFEGHTSRINVVKFSLHHMYTGSDDSTVRRWNLTRGTCSTLFKGHKDKVHTILLDLPIMLSGSTDTATCVWEILRNEDETPDEIADVRINNGPSTLH
jgi:WD40 repeat protein